MIRNLHLRVWLWCALALPGAPLPAMAGGESANVFAVEHDGDGRVRLVFQLNEYHLDLTRATFPDPNVLHLDRADMQRAPAFVRVIEVETGRYAALEDRAARTEIMALPRSTTWTHADEDPVSIQLARMGRRVFVRVEVRPFQPGPGGTDLIVHTFLEASIFISDAVPPSDEPELTLMGFDDPLCQSCPPAVSLGVSEGNGQPEHFAPHRSVTNDVAWKVRISEPGLYRITGEDLAQAGVPETYRDAAQLHMSCRDQVIPVWASTSGAMSAGDWLMFYAAAAQDRVSTQNVYWLSIGAGGAPPEQIDAAPSYSEGVITSSWSVVEYAPKNFYRAAYNPLNDSYDHWFALEVQGGTTSHIPFATPHPVLTGDVQVAYSVHGVNSTANADPDHRSVFRVGGNLADTRAYNGEVRVTGTSSVPATAVSPGSTTVSVEQQVPGGVPHPSFSNAYIEWLRLCYQRRLVAESLPYFFSGPPTAGTVRVVDIPADALWVLDVSNPLQPKEFCDYVVMEDGGAWRIEFEDQEGGGRCYALFDEDAVQSVSSIELVRFRNLADPDRQADHLVVTPAEFREPVFRLLKHRHKNGLTVQVATPDDIYNEFSYGMVTPVGIRQYFGYAYHHYADTKPRYALLVGFGSYDPQKHLGSTAPEHVPVYVGPAPWRRTAWEQWFVTIDGPNDLLPDIRLGRIPAQSVAEVNNMVDKMIAFETAPTNAAWRETAMLVADKVDASNNFKAHVQTNTIPHLVNGGFDEIFDVQTAFLDDLTQVQMQNAIEGAFNGGTHLVHYMGHGGVLQWASPSVWHVNDVTSTFNAVTPIVAVFTCQNGFFYDPQENSLAEALILGAHGSVTTVAPTALSVPLFANRLADGYYEALAVDRVERIGDALQEGFLRLWSFNPNIAELRFYATFGDPALQIWGGAEP